MGQLWYQWENEHTVEIQQKATRIRTRCDNNKYSTTQWSRMHKTTAERMFHFLLHYALMADMVHKACWGCTDRVWMHLSVNTNEPTSQHRGGREMECRIEEECDWLIVVVCTGGWCNSTSLAVSVSADGECSCCSSWICHTDRAKNWKANHKKRGIQMQMRSERKGKGLGAGTSKSRPQRKGDREKLEPWAEIKTKSKCKRKLEWAR